VSYYVVILSGFSHKIQPAAMHHHKHLPAPQQLKKHIIHIIASLQWQLSPTSDSHFLRPSCCDNKNKITWIETTDDIQNHNSINNRECHWFKKSKQQSNTKPFVLFVEWILIFLPHHEDEGWLLTPHQAADDLSTIHAVMISTHHNNLIWLLLIFVQIE